MKNFLPWLAPTVVLSLPLGAFAQQPPDAQPGTPLRALSYQSAFADYKPWAEIKSGDWRQLNDDLGKPAGQAHPVDGSAGASTAQGHTPGHAMPMMKGHHGHPGRQGHQMPGAKP